MVILDRFNLIPVTGGTTVTVHDAFLLLPSLVVAVMDALPKLTPVTTPDALTLATAVLLLDHVTCLSDASEGKAVAANVYVLPGMIKALVLFRFSCVTNCLTVTVHWP
jgi:hypothetical protein